MKLICFLIALSSFSCLAQDQSYDFFSFRGTPDSLLLENAAKTDSVKPHSVKKAVLLSIVPGGGQIYNHIAMPKGKKKAFWKVPLIYAGLGATGYFLISNQLSVNELRSEYNYRIDNNVSFFQSQYEGYDNQGVLALHDQSQTWRDLSILGVSLVYILQLVDAGVEAHFVNFDVSQDLSMSIEPSLITNDVAGLKLSLKFR